MISTPSFDPSVVALLTLGLFALALIHALLALNYRMVAGKKAKLQASLRSTWDPWIVDHLVRNTPAADLHSRIAPGHRVRFVATLIRFARRLSGEERDRVCQLALPYLDAIEARSTSRSPAVRARSVQTLGELGWPHYADTVVGALDDRSPLVAMVAAQMLCRPQAVMHAASVVARLDRFDTWTPMLLASMLANAGPDMAENLRTALTDPSRPSHVRVAAAEALRQLNDFDSAEAAVAVLTSESDREVLAASLRLVGKVGRAVHTQSVVAFIDSPDFVLRVSTADALAGLGGPNELQQLRGMLDDDPSRWVALRAARSLFAAGWREELGELAESSHPRASVAAQVIAEGSVR